jgi:hypothetical protein
LLQAMNNEIATYGRRYYEEWGATHG